MYVFSDTICQEWAVYCGATNTGNVNRLDFNFACGCALSADFIDPILLSWTVLFEQVEHQTWTKMHWFKIHQFTLCHEVNKPNRAGLAQSVECPPGLTVRQQQHTRDGLRQCATCMPLPSMKKTVRSGFETQRRRHQKSKTGVSVVPQKGLVFSKIFWKKKSTSQIT